MATASKTDSELTTEPFGKLADDEGPHSDLEQAFDALRKKKVHFDRLFDYYDGDVGIAVTALVCGGERRASMRRHPSAACPPPYDQDTDPS